VAVRPDEAPEAFEIAGVGSLRVGAFVVEPQGDQLIVAVCLRRHDGLLVAGRKGG
jgi:hypothetical protein